MRSSQSIIDFIKGFEKLSLVPYLCPEKVPTIGWGCTFYYDPVSKKRTPVTMKDKPITKEFADKLFLDVLTIYEDQISKCVKAPLSQNQFDALVSWCYNVGEVAVQNSTLVKELNSGKYSSVGEQLVRWCKDPDAPLGVSQGLFRRRVDEACRFYNYKYDLD